MAEPSICAVMLTKDRPELARRAVECFRRQTYPAKSMLVYETGFPTKLRPGVGGGNVFHWSGGRPEDNKRTIGELRNVANGYSAKTPNFPASDILMHWDDDDWSHPNRIAEQVELLQSPGVDVVGYNEMLFSRRMVSRVMCDSFGGEGPDGRIEVDRYEAWLYSNPNPGYTLGTSLCYWRRTWERKPFPATNVGEDLQFCTGLKCFGVSSLSGHHLSNSGFMATTGLDPRMIARIHAGNTSTAYEPAKMAKNSEWKRVPEWDAHCRSVMEAA